MKVAKKPIPFQVPPEVQDILDQCPKYSIANSVDTLVELAVRDEINGWHEVAYDIPGKGKVAE